MSFLTVSGLHKRYGNLEVLKNVSFDLEKGGFLVLVGPSGCGKSSLLSVIAGLSVADAGEMTIDGRSVNGLPPSERDIAMVFQSYALYPSMTVRRNIGFGLEMRGMPKAERNKAVLAAAESLQISHLLDRKPSQLSGGQRQRVAMGRALVRDPLLFLFDEPLSNLDAKLRVEMRTEIKRLHQRTGATMVYVTHDQIEAMTLATQIAVLDQGVIQQIGTPSEIYERPKTLFVAQFMGSPSMNLLDCEVLTQGGKKCIRVACADQDIRIGLEGNDIASLPADGARLLLGIRPESIVHQSSLHGGSRPSTDITAKIDVVEPTGPDSLVVFKVGERDVTARLDADVQVKAGQTVGLALLAEKGVLFDPGTQRALPARPTNISGGH